MSTTVRIDVEATFGSSVGELPIETRFRTHENFPAETNKFVDGIGALHFPRHLFDDG